MSHPNHPKTFADRLALIHKALAPVALGTLCRSLADSFATFFAARGMPDGDKAERALLTHLLKGGFAVPTSHAEGLAQLRAVNLGLRQLGKVFGDAAPFLAVVRDALMESFLRPALTLADVGAKLSFLDVTMTDEKASRVNMDGTSAEGLLEWCFLEGRGREAVQYQLGRDLERMKARNAA